MAGLLAVMVDGLQHDGWAAKTFLTQKAQFPQVINDGALILTLFPTPGAVGHAIEVA